MFKNIFQMGEYQGQRTWFHKKYYVFDTCGMVFFNTKLEAVSWIKGRNSALELSFKKISQIYRHLNSHYLDNVFCRNGKYLQSSRYSEILIEVLSSFHYLTNQRYVRNHYSRLKYMISELLKLAKLFNYQIVERELLNIQKTVCYEYPRYETPAILLKDNKLKRSKLQQCV